MVEVKSWIKYLGILFLVFSMIILVGCGGSKKVIKLHNPEWDSIELINAIVEFIFEEGYGYEVESITLTAKEIETALLDGTVDVLMEDWKDYHLDWYNENLTNGNLVNLGVTFEETTQGWIIPAWVAEEYKIVTIDDMKKNWKLFQDPNDYSRGIFYNCVAGWECHDINLVKFDAYEMDKYYNIISPGTPESLVQILKEAQENHQPVFAYYWTPAPIMGAYEWFFIKEPPYHIEVWRKIVDGVNDPEKKPIDEACAYQTFPIEKVVSREFYENNKEAVEVLNKMNIGLKPLNDTLGWMMENQITDWEKGAVYYLRNNESRWSRWVSNNAYEKIKKKLATQNN